MSTARVAAGKPIGVWLVYRTHDSTKTHSFFMSTVEANRLAYLLNRTGRVSHLCIQGAYAETPEEIKAREDLVRNFLGQTQITITRGPSEADVRRPSKHNIPEGRTNHTIRDSIQHMSFNAGKLDNDVLLFCPVTGICGKMEFPALPIALTYTHPLAVAGSCLSVLNTVAKQVEAKGAKAYKAIEKQVYAGMLLSLLKRKDKLRTAGGETTAAEQNMVLQGANKLTLWELLDLINRMWDNPLVWRNMPSFSPDWRTHSAPNGGAHIGQTLQSYTKILLNTLEPLALSPEDQAKFFTAQRKKQDWLAAGKPAKGVKVFSKTASEAKNIAANKKLAQGLYEELKETLSTVNRILVWKVIKDLLILPQSIKDETAAKLELSTTAATYPKNRIPATLELAEILRGSQNVSLLEDIGRVTEELSPAKPKTIAEILELKRLKRLDAEERQAAKNEGEAE